MFKNLILTRYRLVANNNDASLYHITYFKNLSSIKNKGLVVGQGTSIGQGAGYRTHSKGKIFLTKKDGISYWYGKAEDWANHNSDNLLDDGLIPIVLKITSKINDALKIDLLGQRDAVSDAFYIEQKINPEDLEVWDGSKWIAITEKINPKLALEYEEDPDDPEDGWWSFKSDYPLIPK